MWLLVINLCPRIYSRIEAGLKKKTLLDNSTMYSFGRYGLAGLVVLDSNFHTTPNGGSSQALHENDMIVILSNQGRQGICLLLFLSKCSNLRPGYVLYFLKSSLLFIKNLVCAKGFYCKARAEADVFHT